MAWTPGQKLQGGKYTIETVIAVGGFSITYKAHDLSGQNVAIKTLNDKLQTSPEFSQFQHNFVNEALRIKGCQHPHIVKVYELFQEGSLWCMVMEYIDGESLYTILLNQGPFTETEALRYIQQIGAALVVVHNNGLLHRDVKPQNIMIRSTTLEAVLIDFGIAREFSQNHPDSHTEFLSHGYAPLEQYFRRRQRGPYTDIYALAATLYVLLTGYTLIGLRMDHRLPSALDRDDDIRNAKKDPLLSPKLLNPYISNVVSQAILKGMELDSKTRPQSVQEWLKLVVTGINQNTPLTNFSYYKPKFFNKIWYWQGKYNYYKWGKLASITSIISLGIASGIYWVFYRAIPPEISELNVKPVYSQREKFTINQSRVCDENGYSDIKEVRFWLKREQDQQWISAPAFEEINTRIDPRCTNFISKLNSNLKPGNYQLRAVVFDQADLQTELKQNFVINAEPKNLKFNTDKNNYLLGEKVKLINTYVCDDNGVEDLNKIDLLISKNQGDFRVLDSVRSLNKPIPIASRNIMRGEVDKNEKTEPNCTNFNYSIDTKKIGAGNFIIKGIAYDKFNFKSANFIQRIKVNAPPKSLDFKFNKNIAYELGEPIIFTDTNVCDDNTVDDITKVYFYIRRNKNYWARLATEANSLIPKSLDERCASFSYALDGFSSTGTYDIYAIAEDRALQTTRSYIKSFTVTEVSTSPNPTFPP